MEPILFTHKQILSMSAAEVSAATEERVRQIRTARSPFTAARIVDLLADANGFQYDVETHKYIPAVGGSDHKKLEEVRELLNSFDIRIVERLIISPVRQCIRTSSKYGKAGSTVLDRQFQLLISDMQRLRK